MPAAPLPFSAARGAASATLWLASASCRLAFARLRLGAAPGWLASVWVDPVSPLTLAASPTGVAWLTGAVSPLDLLVFRPAARPLARTALPVPSPVPGAASSPLRTAAAAGTGAEAGTAAAAGTERSPASRVLLPSELLSATVVFGFACLLARGAGAAASDTRFCSSLMLLLSDPLPRRARPGRDLARPWPACHRSSLPLRLVRGYSLQFVRPAASGSLRLPASPTSGPSRCPIPCHIRHPVHRAIRSIALSGPLLHPAFLKSGPSRYPVPCRIRRPLHRAIRYLAASGVRHPVHRAIHYLAASGTCAIRSLLHPVSCAIPYIAHPASTAFATSVDCQVS